MLVVLSVTGAGVCCETVLHESGISNAWVDGIATAARQIVISP
ncbi:hypothetical protein SB00610_00284 [Klebsiella quasipneumoniae subsp. similipneumoniae]|nr:hypothetical protein SB00610_00284 [Klebsiella quasipneumoniae subsp. similipneumoniae]